MILKRGENSSALMSLRLRSDVASLLSRICLSILKRYSISLLPVIGDSAEIEAVAWVNGTLADDVRQSLDEYIAQIYPSGDDGWISTDEREGVELLLRSVFNTRLLEWVCVTEVLTEEETALIGKTRLGPKTRSWSKNGI